MYLIDNDLQTRQRLLNMAFKLFKLTVSVTSVPSSDLPSVTKRMGTRMTPPGLW